MKKNTYEIHWTVFGKLFGPYQCAKFYLSSRDGNTTPKKKSLNMCTFVKS